MNRRDPSRAPSLGLATTTPDTPDTVVPVQVSAGARVSGPTSAPNMPPPEAVPAPSETDQADETPVKVGPGVGERLATWSKASFTPPEIWSEDRPSLSKQLRYAREGAWGPKTGWHRTAAQVAFWGVSFPTSAAAYAIEWVGERPSRWVVALVLISLAYQLPYVPETVAVLIRIPAWPITATWSLLGLSA